MRIALIGPGIMPIPPTGWGAVEILIWDYYNELKKLGHSVMIINTKDIFSLDTKKPKFGTVNVDGDMYDIIILLNGKKT